MGTPIKERGIRWSERYGDKSSYLKEEMESQIGPGSYFRWEGHDNTTGTDYYVVVSPGYSEKKGYHFFAGLRKMPAEHGASGKKFKSMREALNYAYEMWRVPKPDSMPPGWQGYKVNDIIAKEIIHEASSELQSSHGSRAMARPLYTDSASRQSNNEIVKIDVKKNDIRESMSVQTMQGQYDMRVGPRVLPEQYCFAYMASPVVGFLPALYSRLRFTGVDAADFNAEEASSTINALNPKQKVPYSPKLATCEEPDKALFDKHMAEGAVISERLYDFPKNFQGNQQAYAAFKRPFQGGEDDVALRTWGDTDVEMLVAMPAKASDEQFVKFWNEKFLDAYRQSVAHDLSQAIQTGNPEAAGLQARMDEAKGMQAALVPLKSHTDISDREFIVKLRARDVSLFDEFVGSVSSHVLSRTGMAHVPLVRAKNTASNNFVNLYRRAQEITASGNQEIIKQNGLENGFDFSKPIEQRIRLSGSQMLVYDNSGMPVALSVDDRAKPNWRQEEKAEFVGVRYVLKDPVALVDSYVPGFAQAQKSGDQASVSAALKNFHELASGNKVRITHDMTLDSRTVGAKLSNPTTLAPLVDQFKMPTDRNGAPIPPDQISRMQRFHMQETGMVKPYYVEAAMDKDAAGRPVRAARYFDVKQNAWAYGPMPVGQFDEQGRQKMDGIPTMIEGASMRLVEPDGGVYDIAKNEFPVYDINSRGKFMPGVLNDVNLGPEHASPKGTRKESLGVPNGFVLSYEKHKAQFDPVTGKLTSRHYPPAPFTSSVPEMTDDEGKPIPPESYALQSGAGKNKKVVWTDNMQAMRYLKAKLKIPDEITMPFTRMTMMDLKVIHERANRGKSFYESYKDSLDGFKSQDEAVASGIPPEVYQEYTYGRAISKCGGNTIPQEVFDALAEAKKNPEAAFEPKEGQLWALWSVPPGKVEADGEWYKDKKLGVVFASDEEMAQLDMNIPAIRSMQKDGWEITPRPYSRPDGRSFMLPSLNTSTEPHPRSTYGQEELISYVAGESLVPEDAMGKAPEGAAEEVAEEPQLQAEPGAPPESLVVPSEYVRAPETPTEKEPDALPDAPIVPAQEVAQEEPARPFFQTTPQAPRPRPRPNFMPTRPVRDKVPMTIEELRASSIRLVKLADYFDSIGMTSDADAVDRMLEVTVWRLKRL